MYFINTSPMSLNAQRISELTALAATTVASELAQYADRKPGIIEWLNSYQPDSQTIDSGHLRSTCPCYVDRYTMALIADECGFKVTVKGRDLPGSLKRFIVHFASASKRKRSNGVTIKFTGPDTSRPWHPDDLQLLERLGAI
jgi:hypothetical protein